MEKKQGVILSRTRRVPSEKSYYPEWLVRLSHVNLNRTLHEYNNILIVCHNNPDADAIASGYALKNYIENNLGLEGKCKIAYGGTEFIKKSSLVLMIELLDIEIEHIDNIPLHRYDLVITVDCQPGESNVYFNEQLYTKDFIVIDHHKRSSDFGSNIRIIYEWIDSNYASCSTMIYEMLYSLGYNTDNYIKVSTALMYGLYTDSNRFQNVISKQDELMRINIKHDNDIIVTLQGSNITKDELGIIARAISKYRHNENKRYAITDVDYCDSNILGFVCDTLIEVDTIELCVAFLIREEFIKLSIRSCNDNIKACDVAKYITSETLNSDGGGTLTKAGGTLHIQSFIEMMHLEIMDKNLRETLSGILYDYIDEQLNNYLSCSIS